MSTLPVLFVALLGALSSIPGHAQNLCDATLAGPTSLVSFYPWPTPTPEMIARLRRFAEDPRVEAGRVRLAFALEEQTPDLIVRRMFAPANLKDLRRFYHADAPRPPAGHPLLLDADGLRILLARAVQSIKDEALQRRWMEFFARDPDARVRLSAAQTFLTWSDVKARDQFVETALANRDRVILVTALTGPQRVSPGLRWRLIRDAVDTFEDSRVLKAIKTFPDVERDWMTHWYHDQVLDRQLEDLLATYEFGWRTITEWRIEEQPVSTHEAKAQELGERLTLIGSDEVRSSWMNRLSRLASGRTEVAPFAADALAWAEIHEILRGYAEALRLHPFPAGAQLETNLRLRAAAAGGAPVRLTWAERMMDEEERGWAHGYPVGTRVNWSAADLARFEAGLTE